MSSTLIDTIKSWFITQGQKQADRFPVWKTIVGVIIGILGLAALAYAYYKQWAVGSQLAELKHEKDVQEQEKIRNTVEIKIADEHSKIDTATKNISSIDGKLIQIKTDIATLKENYAKAQNTIAAINSWDDVDKHKKISLR